MKTFKESMRWFGPSDPVSLQDIRQAGCEEVVTALHQIPVGEIWQVEDISARKQLINANGMAWTVVESLPVHEDIKKRSGNCDALIQNYCQSIRNLATCGIKVITYNFMPLMDWMRTDLNYTLETGAQALRFEKSAFIAFDLFLLERPGAEKDYTKDEIKLAKARFAIMSEIEKERIFNTALQSLPGSDEPFTKQEVLAALETYGGIDETKLKQHLIDFLNSVVPVAEEAGIKLAIHPDDPPFSILGLPRIMKTAADARELFSSVPSDANGLCFCTGSFGARADNDLPEMVKEFGKRIHFFHLRSTERNVAGDFFEANHLEGTTSLYDVVREAFNLVSETKIPVTMRPDHGHRMLDDLHKTTYPGYSAIGRLKGLAELRGLEMGIRRTLSRKPGLG